jgi:hypothetical protein
MLTAPALPSAEGAHAAPARDRELWMHAGSVRSATPFAAGEEPAGRVLQNVGVSGYGLVSTDAADSISISVEAPNVACGLGVTGPVPYPWQSNMTGSSAVFLAQIGGVGVDVMFGCNDYGYGYGAFQLSTDPGCNGEGCPLRTVDMKPGDELDVDVSTDGAGNATSSIYDETNGNGLSYTGAIRNYSFDGTTEVNILENDFCYFEGAGTPCVFTVPNGESTTTPPGWSSYAPIDVTGATINGNDLEDELSASEISTWYQVDSVYGTTLFDETSAATGGSFSITNSDRQLPALQISSQSVDVSSSDQTLPFTVSLSQESADQIYIDYTTGDDTAYGGINYTPVSGTLSFPPGTTSQTVDVPVRPGLATGGDIDFFFGLSNPSYVGFGQSLGVGTIYEGPNVEGVTPNMIPTNGHEPLVVAGVDFGAPGDRTTVQFCNASGNCVDGVKATVQSDNQIDVTSPDASSLLNGDESTVQADTIVAGSSGVASPAVPADMVTFGCNQVLRTDGEFTYAACVIPSTQPDTNETEQDSNIDGVNVTASAQDQVDYGSGTATSTGPVTMSLNMAGQNVNLFKGVLNQDMTAPMAYHPQGSVGGFKFAGQMTLTGTAGSDQSSGQVAVTAPVWLGGGQGTMTFTTATNGGTVQNLQVTMGSGSFGDLLSLTSPTAVYSGGTWQLSGQASAGGGSSATTTTLDGSFTYSGTTLTGGSLTLAGAIPLFGTVLMGGFDLNYTEGSGWSGTAQAGAAPSLAGLTLSFSASPTGLITKGTITLSSGLLLGELQVATATLTTDNAGWSLAVVLPGGSSPKSSIKGNLTVTAGVVTAGSITAKKVSIGLGFSISGSLTYALNGGNQIWDATVGLGMPAAPEGGLAGSVTGVQIGVTYVNGVPSGTQITFTGSVPLQDGLFLTQLGAGVQWNPTLVLSNATVGIGFGPEIDGVRIASITGTYTAAIPPIAPVAYQSFVGTLTVGTYQIGQATATAYEDGTTNLSLELGQGGTTGFQVGKLSVVANLTGSITSAGMTLTGNASVTFAGQQFFAGTLNANLKGMAACNASDQGFVWNYGQSGTSPYWVPQGCAAKLASF